MPEVQSVASHALDPTLAKGVKESMPKLLPYTVTLADPVAALFVRRVELSDGESNEKAWVRVPDRIPDVTTILWLVKMPCGTRQMTLVRFVDQTDASHAVCPMRETAV